MIRNCFIFLKGIGPLKEKRLIGQGISSWDIFLDRECIKGIPENKKIEYDKKLTEAKRNLHNLNSAYFKSLLPAKEMWRLYDHFREEACFLDIETTGLSRHSSITVIGIYDGYKTKTWVKGINLDPDIVREELKRYKLIVTFNGSCFDLPMIKKQMPGILPDIGHLDLKDACRQAGLTGGLKKIEKKLGIKRASRIVEEMEGGDALRLWKMYRASGDKHYLRLLIQYNEEDIINLKPIAEIITRKAKEKHLRIGK